MHRSRLRGRNMETQGSDEMRRSNVPTYRVSLGKSGGDTDPHAYFSPRGGDYVYSSGMEGGHSSNLRDGWVSETIDYSNSSRYGGKRFSSRDRYHAPRSYSSSKFMDGPHDIRDEYRRPASTTRAASRRYESEFSNHRPYDSARFERSRGGPYIPATREHDGYPSSLAYDRYTVGGGAPVGPPSRRNETKYAPWQESSWESPSRADYASFSPPVSTRSMPVQHVATDVGTRVPMRARRDSTPYRAEISKLATQALFLQDRGRFEEARSVIDEIDRLQQEAELAFGSMRLQPGHGDSMSNGHIGTAPISTLANGHRQGMDAAKTNSSRTDSSPRRDNSPIKMRDVDTPSQAAAPQDDTVGSKPDEPAETNFSQSTNVESAVDSNFVTNDHDDDNVTDEGKMDSTDDDATEKDVANASETLGDDIPMPAPVNVDEMPQQIPPPMIFSPIEVEEAPKEKRRPSVVLDQRQAAEILEGLSSQENNSARGTTTVNDSIAEAGKEHGIELSGFGDADGSGDDDRDRASSLVRQPEDEIAESECGVPLIVGPQEQQEVYESLLRKSQEQQQQGGNSSNTSEFGYGSWRSTFSPTSQQHASTPSAPPLSPRSAAAKKAKDKKQDKSLVMLTKEGWMKKAPPQTGTKNIFARWQTRYFILSGHLLLYYKNPEDKVPKGIVNLLNATVTGFKVPVGKLKSKSNYEVRVLVTNLRTHRFVCSTKQEAISWITAIINNVSAAAAQDITMEDISVKKKKKKKSKSSKKSKLKAVTSDEQEPVQEMVGKDITLEDEVEDGKLWGYYKLLKVPIDAPMKDIKKSYHKMIKDKHPDKNPDVAQKLAANLNEAYGTLKDEAMRAQYDLRETVKCALRSGVEVILHDNDGTATPTRIMMDAAVLNLYFQPSEFGNVLQKGYKSVELRFIEVIYAGCVDWEPQDCDPECCLTMQGARLGIKEGLRVQMKSPAERDELLDGLRVVRCAMSMLFKQKLDKMFTSGLR